MSADKPIGLFDSGIGGLSVARAVRHLLPAEDLIYCADNAFAPYGNKTVEQIRSRSLDIAERLVGLGCKAIVVACNTATAAAVDALRAVLTVPVVAMEPALKPAAALTRSDIVGVLATAGTLASPRYAALRDRHGHRVKVIERVCHTWVARVEEGKIAGRDTAAAVAYELEPLLHAGADVLVLGCTHFPYLTPLIEEIAGNSITVVDPSPAVATQLERRLAELGLLRPRGRGAALAYATDPARIASDVAALMLRPSQPWREFPTSLSHARA